MKKALLFMCIALVLLMGYVWYFEQVKYERDRKTESLKDKLFDLTAIDKVVDSLQVNNEHGSFQFVHKDNSWQLVEPIVDRANNGTIGSAITRLGLVDYDRIIEEHATDLKKYGLDAPRIKITFSVKDQEGVQSLLLGKQSPTGALYAMKGDDDSVYLLGAYVENAFTKPLGKWRDQQLLNFDSKQVSKATLTRGKAVIEFVRQGDTWLLNKPLETPADKLELESLINYVASMQFKSVATESSDKLNDFALDKPSAQLKVELGTADNFQFINLGGPVPDNNDLYFAKVSGRDAIFTVDKAAHAKLIGKSLFDFRSKLVLRALPSDVKKLEVITSGKASQLIPTDDKWTADQEALINFLDDLRVKRFVNDAPGDLAQYGLSEPWLNIKAMGSEKALGAIILGQKNGKVFGQRIDRSYVFELDSTVPTKWAGLWQKATAPAEASDKKTEE